MGRRGGEDSSVPHPPVLYTDTILLFFSGEKPVCDPLLVQIGKAFTHLSGIAGINMMS